MAGTLRTLSSARYDGTGGAIIEAGVPEKRLKRFEDDLRSLTRGSALILARG